MLRSRWLRWAALAAVVVVALQQYVRSVLPPLASGAGIGLLWLGLVFTFSLLKAFTFGCVAITLHTATKIAEAASTIYLFQFHTSTAVLWWVVGLLCVQALAFHVANPVIEKGFYASSRAVARTSPSIHSRWHAEHESWWFEQLFKLRAAIFLIDAIKMALLMWYLWGLRGQKVLQNQYIAPFGSVVVRVHLLIQYN